MNIHSSGQQLVALALLLFCALAVVLGVVKLNQSPGGARSSGDKPASGTFLGGSGDRLAYIKLDGIIMEDEDEGALFSQESSAVRARKLLHYAAKDPSVKGVLLRMNSPGGTVAMSQELYNAILTVKKEKPVVVSMGDVAASGAYYTAAAADRIIANPGTLTASIGVILQSVNLEELLNNKLGIKTVTVKSGRYKDILSPYRPATKDELELLQGIIDTSYSQFLKAVIDGRTGGIKDAAEKQKRIASITAVADGRVVIGEEALKAGLVDAVGGLEDARKILQELAGKRFNIADPSKLTLQEYETPFDIWRILGGGSAAHSTPPVIKWLSGSSGSGSNSRQMLPVSLRYANQPLWVMESLY